MTFEEDKVITLSDSISKYRYLDFYTDLSGVKPIATFLSTNTYFEMQLLNTANNLKSLWLYYNEIRLNKLSDTKLQIHNVSCFYLKLEVHTIAMKKEKITVAYIYKIIGRKV